MTYDYRIAGHYGKYLCVDCGLRRPDPDVEVTSLGIAAGEITVFVNSEFGMRNAELRRGESSEFYTGSDSGHRIRLAFPSLTGAYNLASAIAAAAVTGIDAGVSTRALDGFELKNGRTMYLEAGSNKCLLLVSKHENSLSYNQSLTTAIDRGRPCTIIILVDSISRKYYTSETSWLWDVDFDILSDECVKNVVLAGRYSNELMARIAMTAVDQNKCTRIEEVAALKGYAASCETDNIYILTCFADKAKLLKAFK